MRLENEISVQRRGDVTILDIQGDVTSLSELPLKDAYRNAVDKDARNIILKFEEDAYINSGGIALIIQILYEVQENKQAAAIAGISEHYKKIFSMVGITKFAKIFDTLDEAAKAFEC